MAYYTIAHKIRNFPPEILTPAVFDYIFLGKDYPDLPEREKMEEIRREFLYWYPYDFRFSAKDLISNHLTFQIFHHVAIMPRELLPRGMVVFGMGLLNGAKMSSSKGNVFLLEDALDEFGADTVRMFLVGSAEPWQDFDWRNDLVSSTKRQIERFYSTIQEIGACNGEPATIDKWLLSRLQHRITRTTEALDRFQTRQALQDAFHGIETDLRWYRRRLPEGVPGSSILNTVAQAWVRLLAPFTPFTCEDLWARLGCKDLVSFAQWPVPDDTLIDPATELAEELLSRTVEDIESILKIIPFTATSITICTANSWKRTIFTTVAASSDRSRVAREVMQDEAMRQRGKESADVIKQCVTLVHRLPPDIVSALTHHTLDEPAIFQAAIPFLQREFGLPVRVTDADAMTHPKAAAALPFKPAIIIE